MLITRFAVASALAEDVVQADNPFTGLAGQEQHLGDTDKLNITLTTNKLSNHLSNKSHLPTTKTPRIMEGTMGTTKATLVGDKPRLRCNHPKTHTVEAKMFMSHLRVLRQRRSRSEDVDQPVDAIASRRLLLLRNDS